MNATSKPAKPASPSSQQDGLRFIYAHHRYRRDTDTLDHYVRHGEGRSYWEPTERGGLTVCNVLDEADNVLGVGRAECSEKDSYNYRVGRDIARGRALQDAGLLDAVRVERKARRAAARLARAQAQGDGQ